MGKSSNKEKKKSKKGAKARSATKVQPSKRSKVSINNNDIYQAPKNPVFGNPTAYLYGKDAIDAKQRKKRQRQSKRDKARGLTNQKSSNFVPRKGGKRGKRIFICRFPVVGTNTKPAPWMKKNNGVGKENKSDTKRKIMNGAFSVDETALKLFNVELEQFATYVRLTKPEIKAREYLIQQIQKSCKNLFGVEDSDIQVFGSFAALSVCIFESDIDLAIWGVVEPDITDDDTFAKPEPAKRKSATLNNNDVQQSRANQKKQERVLKWKALIDNATSIVEESDKSQDKKDKLPAKADESDETPLFVLDRIGDVSSLDLNDRSIDLTNENNDEEEEDDDDDDRKPAALPIGRDPNTGKRIAKIFDDVICYGTIQEMWHKKKQKRWRVLFDDDVLEDWNASELEIGKKLYSNNPEVVVLDDDDEESGDSPSESDDSHTSDSADKLENFWSRKRPRETSNDSGSGEDSGDEEEVVEFNDIPKGRPRGQSLVSLSSDTTCSVEANLDDSEMEVSFIVGETKPAASAKVGPTGATRTKVIKALYRLTKKISQFATNVHVRRHARVPIINMVTRFGFECDIALGGHNGTDTSSYASTQLARFKSFPILVVFLKVLLSQQGLDKPFTGGLGSYTLYVLVASHIEQHLDMGGADDPAELLYTFLFRYGGVKHMNNKISSSCRTRLSQDLIVQTSDGGSADLKSCFQIENCISVFENCWQMLQKRLKGNFNQRFSILQYMIDASKLEQRRRQCKTAAKNKLPKLFDEGFNARSFSPTASIAGLPREEKKDTSGDLEARELIKAYGQNVDIFQPVKETSTKKGKKKWNKARKKKKQKTAL
mmetsp:Transcript_15607/g.39261  ORF Transcript_15607/g.39261 Transcript_15607/m.39261 type:complete len:828 (+) Transcript_15607:139-2622(+)